MTEAREEQRSRDAPWRAARRAAALRHHPDRGGDPAELVRALAEVDRRFAPAAAGEPPVVTVRLRRTRRWRRWWRTRPGRRRRAARWIDI